MARPVNMLLSMVTTAVLVRFMGVEPFGAWAVWQNLAGVLGGCALGVPMSVMNHVSAAKAANDAQRLSQIVSTAFFMMVVMGAMVLVIAGGWLTVANSSSGLAMINTQPDAPTMTGCAAVFILYAALNLAVGLFDRVTVGYQDGWVSAGCQVAGSLISLAFVGVACWLDVGLTLVAAGWAAGSLSGFLVNAAVARVRYGDWVMPRLAAWSTTEMWRLLADGWQFMLLGFIALIALQSDPLLIGIWAMFGYVEAGGRAVAEMAIPLRYFNVASAVVFVFLGPLWPAYADAKARKDVEWSRRTLTRSIFAAAVSGLLLIIPATFFGRTFLTWWVGEDVAVPPSLLLAFGAWGFVTILSYPVVMYLNGFGQLRFQLVMGLIFFVCVLPAKFIGLAWFGATGMIAATVIMFVLLQLLPLLWLAFMLTRPGGAT